MAQRNILAYLRQLWLLPHIMKTLLLGDLMSKYLKLLTFILAGSLNASGEVTITRVQMLQDCQKDKISIVEENGEYFIAAFFTNMNAIAETNALDKKRCTMKYNVQISPGYMLDVFQFSVDGVYQLSEHGSGRLTVAHRVVNNDTIRHSKIIQSMPGEPSSLTGDIKGFRGSITNAQLAKEYTKCGATIPLNTSVYAEAGKSQQGISGLSRVSLSEAASSHFSTPFVKLCQIKIKPCSNL